jgi:adenylosuccinate synthase
VVVDPDVLVNELAEIGARGIDTSKLVISERAHVIMPYHVV